MAEAPPIPPAVPATAPRTSWLRLCQRRSSPWAWAAALSKSSEHEAWIKDGKQKLKLTTHPHLTTSLLRCHSRQNTQYEFHDMAKYSTSSCFFFKKKRVPVLDLVLKSKKNGHAKLVIPPPSPPLIWLCPSSSNGNFWSQPANNDDKLSVRKAHLTRRGKKRVKQNNTFLWLGKNEPMYS